MIQEANGFAFAGEATDGEASVEAASMLRPDIVVMDINLPGHQRGRRHPTHLRRIAADDLAAGVFA